MWVSEGVKGHREKGVQSKVRGSNLGSVEAVTKGSEDGTEPATVRGAPSGTPSAQVPALFCRTDSGYPWSVPRLGVRQRWRKIYTSMVGEGRGRPGGSSATKSGITMQGPASGMKPQHSTTDPYARVWEVYPEGNVDDLMGPDMGSAAERAHHL